MLPFRFFTIIFPDDSFQSSVYFLFFMWWCDQMLALASSFWWFLAHTMMHKFGRTPLEGRSDIQAHGGIRTRNPSKRAAPDPCLEEAATGIDPLNIIRPNILLLLHVACTFNSKAD